MNPLDHSLPSRRKPGPNVPDFTRGYPRGPIRFNGADSRMEFGPFAPTEAFPCEWNNTKGPTVAKRGTKTTAEPNKEAHTPYPIGVV